MNAPLTSYKFVFPLLLAMFSMPAAQAAQNAAAGILSSVGEVKAINSQGVSRPLSKGASIAQGDTIHTAQNARAQLRFSDGAMVALQPDSQFRIDEYQFSGKEDGQEKGFFSLIKGGLRTITGWVGRSNRDNYKLSTTVATIGIRGTGFTVFITPDNALHASVGEGAIALSNEAGSLVLGSGESGIVERPGVAPQRIGTLVYLPPAQPGDSNRVIYSRPDTYQREAGQGNVQLAAGLLENPPSTTPPPTTPVDPPQPPTPPVDPPQPPTPPVDPPQPPTPPVDPTPPTQDSSRVVHYIATYGDEAPIVKGGQLASPYEFDANNQLVKISQGGVATPLKQSAGRLGDNALYYGVWQGISGGSYDGSDSKLMYLAGTPVMPQVGATYNFANLGSVAAFSPDDDSPSANISSAQLIARLSGTPKLDLGMKVLINSALYEINGSTSQFAAGRFGFAGQSVKMDGYSNSSFKADGFFAGATADYAAMSFDFERPDEPNPAGANHVNGLAAFQKSGPSAPVGNTAHDVHYLAKTGSNDLGSGKLAAPYEFDAGGEKLVKIIQNGVATPLSQSAGNYNGALYYGTWSGIEGGTYDGGASALHYLAGTPVAPAAINARYDLLAGPASLAFARNADAVSLRSAQLKASLSGAAPNLGVQMEFATGNSSYAVSGTTTDISAGRFSFANQSVSASTGARNTSFDARGFFAGRSADYAGMSFDFDRPELTSDKEINGIAAFQKYNPEPPVSNTMRDVHYVAKYGRTDIDSGKIDDNKHEFDSNRYKLVKIDKDGVATPLGQNEGYSYEGLLFYGKWTGVDGGVFDGSDSVFHYLAGTPVTPPSTSARYDLLSGSASKAFAENADTVSINYGRLNTNFSGAALNLDLQMVLSAGRSSYAVYGTTTDISSGRFAFDDQRVRTSSGPENNSFDAKGFFAGSSASHAGMSFAFDRPDLADNKEIAGIAAFEKYVPPTVPVEPPAQSGTVRALKAADWPTENSLLEVSGTTTNVANVTKIMDGSNTYTITGTVSDTGNDGGIYWGRWAEGNHSNGVSTEDFDHLRYIAAATAVMPTLPVSGWTAVYEFSGGNADASVTINSGQIMFKNTGNDMSVSIQVTTGGESLRLYKQDLPVSSVFSFSGGSVSTLTSLIPVNNSFHGQGLFAGNPNPGGKAGVVFGFKPPSSVGNNFLSGSATFTRGPDMEF